MYRGKDRNKKRFKNRQLCSVWKHPFCDHRAIKRTQNTLALPIRVSVSSFRLPSLVNTPLGTWSSPPAAVYCRSLAAYTALVFWRDITLRFLVLIFTPARSHAAENRWRACWRRCWEDASSAKSSAKSKRLILQLPNVTPSSTQLWLSTQIMYTTFFVQITLLHEFRSKIAPTYELSVVYSFIKTVVSNQGVGVAESWRFLVELDF